MNAIVLVMFVPHPFPLRDFFYLVSLREASSGRIREDMHGGDVILIAGLREMAFLRKFTPLKSSLL